MKAALVCAALLALASCAAANGGKRPIVRGYCA